MLKRNQKFEGFISAFIGSTVAMFTSFAELVMTANLVDNSPHNSTINLWLLLEAIETLRHS